MNHTTSNVYPLDLSQDNLSPFYLPQGRIGRATFIAWNMLLFLSAIAFLCLCYNVLAVQMDTDSTSFILWLQGYIAEANLFFYAYNAVIWYFITIFTVKRVHDLGYSGWLALLNLVPLVNVFFSIWLILKKGQLQQNQYGGPRITKPWESILGYAAVMIGAFLLLIFISAFSQMLSYLF